MSAQYGLLNVEGAPVTREAVLHVSSLLANNGPDGEFLLVNGPIGLLYRPFHTTAESRTERQPFTSGSGRIFVWDGRLDNREDLVPQLGQELSSDNTDVAIVAAGFDKWGTSFFCRIRGDWALTIWDPLRRELTLARDYLGIRRLYYHSTSNSLAWCSRLEPLVLCGSQFNLNEEYIAGYLSFHPDAHLTPFHEILSVPPGSFVTLAKGNLRVHRYHSFDPELRIRYKTDGEYEEQYRHLFRQSVRRRLRTDSFVLADLSGGLDSSSIVCMADQVIAHEGTETPGVDTFSFFDPEEPDADDQEFFTKVEEQRGRRGHSVEIHATGDTLTLTYAEFVAIPGFNGTTEINSAMREILQRKPYRVSLSGHGGDELNGQALDFRVQIADLLATWKLREAGRLLVDWSLRSRYPFIQLLGQSCNLLLPMRFRFGKRSQLNDMAPWLPRDLIRRYRPENKMLLAGEGSWRWLASARDGYQTLETIAREINFLGQSDLDKRYPYLDQDLAEFLTAIPTEQILRPGHRRSLMRRALTPILPKEVCERRSKATTGRCVALALQKHWQFIETLFRTPLSSRFGFIDHDTFQRALSQGKHGQLPSIVNLLRALSLELWLRQVVECGVVSAPGTSVSSADRTMAYAAGLAKQHIP